ncbi:MAG: helix-turn-helix transcriptional regulator [Bacteroidetes bacterium]|nr:helix-turn-helix transcriptional regulator [Bacteroidota bacterium]
MDSQKFTYIKYLRDSINQSSSSDDEIVFELTKIFKKISSFKSAALPLFFIIDYAQNSYAFMSEGVKAVLQYDAMDFMENGVQKTLDIFHKEDFKLYNQKIFQHNLSTLKMIPQKEHKDLSFTYNFRLRSRNKKMINLLQKGFYITDDKTGLPKYSIGSITDITDVFTKENLVSHIIEKSNLIDGKQVNEVLVKNYFFSGEENTVLTKQERIILLCLADGLSSKLISEKLHISVNTVNNHRQNILVKTGASNVAQLIVYAVKNKII